MGDLTLTLQEGVFDFQPSESGILTGNDIYTATIISIFTDKRANNIEDLPQGLTDKRGWWGGDIGSHLWLLSREKATPQTASRARTYAREALQWMLDEGLAEKVEVDGDFVSGGTLQLSISITRGTAEQYAYLWNDYIENTNFEVKTRGSLVTINLIPQ